MGFSNLVFQPTIKIERREERKQIIGGKIQNSTSRQCTEERMGLSTKAVEV